MSDQIIRASEVEQYAYCARAWWLNRVQGLTPANGEELDRGRNFHNQHGGAVAASRRLRRWALILVGLMALCLIALLLRGMGH
ncbi:MAG: hypothetical protein U9Q78_07850 [Chloroflexota bacterium]|nr:hypothetical protein [Chloroflexota bacterium]